MLGSRPHDTGQGLTPLGKVVLAVFVIGLLGAGTWLLLGDRIRARAPRAMAEDPAASAASAPTADRPGAGPPVAIGIAYGTEKKLWLEQVTKDFARTPAGARITVNLIPMGSLEGAQAVLAGDKRIHVWSPASSLYKGSFLEDWKVRQSGNPILREENLALTPMVFVFWEERYKAFAARYRDTTFATVGQALDEKGGWNTIAGHPEWGLFKFGHTHPNQSNSGLVTLVLMAYEFHDRERGLGLPEVLDTGFQTWMARFERSVTGLANSTGNLMKEMVLKGPSAYDGVFVYENVAIDFLRSAQGRWGDLRVVYPRRNTWNENPYYVLDVPWSGAAERAAAGAFLDYLMSEPVQRLALEHGFRPGNPAVAVQAADSPFTLYASRGLAVELPSVCAAPGGETIQNLLASWQRSQAGR